MWHLQRLISNTRPGQHLAGAAVSSLVILLALSISGSSLIAAENVKTSRRIRVTCDCREHQPAATLITQLGDHNLTLKNFRAAESQGSLPLTVDAESGAVCTTNDDQFDFESQREFQFRVLADEESEYDEFLAEFSAGLVDAGLPEGELKPLSVSTVVFEITVRVHDVSELPDFEDSRFSVELVSDAPVEFGCVTTTHQTASMGWQFYIASGNEDGIFEIDAVTGVLTLAGDAAGDLEIQEAFELQVLVENSAGESETAHVFVNAHRKIPVLVSEATSSTPSTSTQSTTGLPEENSESGFSEASAVLKENEPQGSNAETNLTQENPANSEETEKASNINTLPNIDEIDVAEVEEWVGDTERVSNIPIPDSSDMNHNAGSGLPIASPASNSSAGIIPEDSPGDLLTMGAFSIFLAACIAVVLTWSRTAVVRAQKLDDEASEERHKAALHGIQQDEEIRLLKSALADRDQTIAKLKKELRSITHDFESDDHDDCQLEPDRDSRASGVKKPSSDSRLMKEEPQVASLPHLNSTVEARTSLGFAFDQIGLELARETHWSPCLLPAHEEAGKLSCDSTEAAVATLDEHQDLRCELADLFPIPDPGRTEPSTESSDRNLDVDLKTVGDDASNLEQLDEQAETSLPEVLQIKEQASEDLHLDSVKLYLEKLLERSQDPTTPESILVDHRKAADFHRGIDRRAKPEPYRPPVMSYLEAYMSAHGGELAPGAVTTNALPSKPKLDAVSEPLKARPPVDVDSIRESMDSFRVVAIHSFEHALLSHLLRETKAKIAWRTVMIAGLAGITALIFLANMKRVIDFSPLNWLMPSLVLLSAADLFLRIHAVIKQRRNVTSSVLPPRPTNRPDARCPLPIPFLSRRCCP